MKVIDDEICFRAKEGKILKLVLSNRELKPFSIMISLSGSLSLVEGCFCAATGF